MEGIKNNNPAQAVGGVIEIVSGVMQIHNAPRNTIKFDGLKVKQNSSLFDPNYTERGKSNIERMKQGRAPIGIDGKPINLHHINQNPLGPIQELTQTYHQKNYSILHKNIGTSPSLIDRNEFSKRKSDYWKFRSNDF